MGPEEGNRKKFNAGIFIAFIVLVGAAVAFGYYVYIFAGQNKAKHEAWVAGAEARMTPEPTPEATPEPTPTVTPLPTKAPASVTPALLATQTPTPEPEIVEADQLQSAYACAIRGSDGAVIVDKNAEDQVYPASMSKIMTAVVALEHLEDLSAKIVVYPEDIDPAFEAEASLAGFEPYEEVTVQDLLYGVMLPSGAEACSALATAVSETEEDFVALMNEKAQELGLKGTHFTNTTGLQNEDHYTTCQDMANLLHYAMQNETFRKIAGTSEYTCTPTEQHPDGLSFSSTVYAGMITTTFMNGAVFEGGKTGTTEEAGKCLASAAAFYGEEYFLVTAQAPLESNGNFDDAVVVFGSIQRQ